MTKLATLAYALYAPMTLQLAAQWALDSEHEYERVVFLQGEEVADRCVKHSQTTMHSVESWLAWCCAKSREEIDRVIPPD